MNIVERIVPSTSIPIFASYFDGYFTPDKGSCKDWNKIYLYLSFGLRGVVDFTIICSYSSFNKEFFQAIFVLNIIYWNEDISNNKRDCILQYHPSKHVNLSSYIFSNKIIILNSFINLSLHINRNDFN